jgi:hypothetical protein
MKKKIVMLLAIALGSVTAVNAQVRVSEPEFEQQVLLLTSDSTGVLLDKEKSTMKTSTSKWGMIPIPGASLLDKAKTFMRIEGKEAKVITKDKHVRLIVRAEKNSTDPTEMFGIVKFDVKKKNREYLFAEGGLLSGTQINFGKVSEKFKASKYGTSSYLIELDDLQPGQYGLSSNSVFSAATFAVQ